MGQMKKEQVKSIIIDAKFAVTNGILWQFNDNTLLIDGVPVTTYNLYEENGNCCLHTEHPLATPEDYTINIIGENHSPYTILLTPKTSKDKVLILKQEFSF